MPEIDNQIGHVSDTALLVAACRALETEDPDGLIRDPLAELLAGERGMAIAAAYPRLMLMRYGVGIRSHFLDELVTHVTQQLGVEAVLSVGAGLDTRPWRLDVPSGLRWIEVDFPAMLDYKAARLAGQQPRCRIERVAADLTDAAQRQAVFAATAGAPTLLITEGLLSYLPGDAVAALAAESAPLGNARYWLMDLTSPQFAQRVGMDSDQAISSVRADGHLDGDRIRTLIEAGGWLSCQQRTYAKDMWNIDNNRIRALRTAPPPAAGSPSDDYTGVHLYCRA